MQREKYRPAAKFASFFHGQKFTAKCLLALSLFVSAPLFANEMCTQLCAPCMEKTNDSTCVQINALCSCQALIDSIQSDGSNLYIRTNLKNVALPIYSENVEAMPEAPQE